MLLLKPIRPIVGIVSLPCTNPAYCPADVKGIIPASYVKYLESAGAQVVVIPQYWSTEKVRDILDHLSGVLFTGGDWGDADYNRTTKVVYDEVLKRDDLALWGTCLGYERIMQLVAGDDDVVTDVPLFDFSVTVKWRKDVKSKVFDSDHFHLLKNFEAYDIAYNNHHYGVTPERWEKFETTLSKSLKVLATSKSPNGTEFIAMVEGISKPIWAVQFHPEKAVFEWSPDHNVPHTKSAVQANRALADFFVDQVRHFPNRSFPTFEAESEVAIYNYNLIFTGLLPNGTRGIYTEVYVIS
jgi:gamma-glutamyl hydrolase